MNGHGAMSIILRRLSSYTSARTHIDDDDDDSTTTTASSMTGEHASAPEDSFGTYDKPVLLNTAHAHAHMHTSPQQQQPQQLQKRSGSTDSYGSSEDAGTSASVSPEEPSPAMHHNGKPAMDASRPSPPKFLPPPRASRPTILTTPPTTPPATATSTTTSSSGTLSLPTSPDLLQSHNLPHPRRPLPPHMPSIIPSSVPNSPIHGRRSMPRPGLLGTLPQAESMRVSPAVLLTPAVGRVMMPLYPLPSVVEPREAPAEEREMEARRARRVVPVLMSPRGEGPPAGAAEEEEAGTSSPGSSDDEGEDSDGTSTEGDARSRESHSSSEGSSARSTTDEPIGLGIRHSAERERRGRRRGRESEGSSEGTARWESREREGGMMSLGEAMAPLGVGRGEETPKPRAGPSRSRERDYFSSKPAPTQPGAERSPLQTPRPRPGLYHQVSRSLVDLNAAAASAPLAPLALPVPARIPEAPEPPPIPPPYKSVKRRTSLPSLQPPPYTPAYPHHLAPPPSSAREEEGREPLPSYTCTVHIEGTLQRKMEFSAPGVQAKDRSWKRYWFELHGTGLRVFRQDLRRVGVKGYRAWEGGGEGRHVHLPPGVGEQGLARVGSREGGAKATGAGRRASTSTAGGSPPSSFQSAGAGLLHRSALSSSSSLHTSHSGTTSTTSATSTTSTSDPSPSPPASTSPPSSSTEKPLPQPNTAIVPSLSKSSLPSPSNPTTASTSLHRPHLPHFHHGNAMVRHYTLQGAESGLGADYKKRKNVIRVRAEGEQFLLQAESLVEVVNWIEAFQAATNIALDLDQRPMPKIPTLPRRRRRRRPPTDPSANPAAAAGAAGAGAGAGAEGEQGQAAAAAAGRAA